LKIIDDKGRVFGRINIIDLGVLIILACMVMLLYFGYRVMARDRLMPELKPVTVEVKFSNLAPELADLIREGDVEISDKGKAIGTLTKILSNKPSDIVLLTEKVFAVSPHPFYKELKADLNILCEDEKGRISYNKRIIKAGKEFVFSTDKYEVVGLITNVRTE